MNLLPLYKTFGKTRAVNGLSRTSPTASSSHPWPQRRRQDHHAEIRCAGLIDDRLGIGAHRRRRRHPGGAIPPNGDGFLRARCTRRKTAPENPASLKSTHRRTGSRKRAQRIDQVTDTGNQPPACSRNRPTGSGSAWPWAACWCGLPMCTCLTSRSATSTLPRAAMRAEPSSSAR